MNQNINPVNQLKLSVFAKICPTCGEKFVPKNRKRVFCGPYCKQVWHYEKSKLEFTNENLMAAENLKNYKVLKECDKKGIHELSAENLTLLGYCQNVIAPVTYHDGKIVAIYNCYGLYFENNIFKIIKLNQWKLNK